ncbi:hypothetical protein KGF54_004233 [Candida jiufengensis]|uniref:uncharacterized protein n=1 Tax=Candida jiufengensis TaxID=497108 RepID=UPI002225B154|nr:uncharacterized protein KGF54_004233 [Candida jiufengensis]KAI5951159.1 hypothetical protein KGF54_004233 [Candida jiufengensis]
MSIEYIEADHIPRTRMYHKQSKTEKNDYLILIPGNPGLINYYVTYLDYIQEKLPQFEIFCIEYLGFLSTKLQKDSKGNQVIYSVDDQVTHKFNIIKKILKENSQPVNLFFLSHSLGSFITERVILKLQQDESLHSHKIKFNGMITPTVYDIANSESGTILTRMISWNIPFVGLAMTLSLVLNYIPQPVVKYILTNNWKPPKQVITKDHHNLGLENSLEATIDFINSPCSINQCLNMAKDEMIVVDKSNTVNDELFFNSGVYNWCFFAQSDHWVSTKTRDFLISRYSDSGKNLMEICKNLNNPIKHAFVLNQSKEFADITIDRLKPFV